MTIPRRHPTASLASWKSSVEADVVVAGENPADEPAAVEAADELAADQPVAMEHVSGDSAWTGPVDAVWKKEVSFSRKQVPPGEPVPDEPAPDEPVPAKPAAVTGPEPVDETVWKKEVSFNRKPADVEPVLAEESVVPEAPFVPEEFLVATEPVAAEEPVVPDEFVVATEPVAAEGPVAEDPVVTAEPLAFPEPLAAEEPVTTDPEPWNAPGVLPPLPVDDVVAEAPDANLSAPETEVHPPVPAAELRSLPDEKTKVPFWKKEIAFGGKKRGQTPKPQKEQKERKQKTPKAERAPKTKEPKQLKERKQKVPKVKAGTRREGSKADHRPEDRCFPAGSSARLEQRQRRAAAGRARASGVRHRRRWRATRPRRPR